MSAKSARVLGSVLVLMAGLALPSREALAAGVSGRSVRRTPLPDGVLLGYEWTDARGVRRGIDLPVPDSALEASELALGFSVEELQSFLVAAEAGIREEMGISALDIAREVVSRISDPERCRVNEDPESEFQIVVRTGTAGRPVEQAEIDRVVAAYRRRWEASRKAVCARLQARLKEYAGDHGMEVTPQGIAVDYKRLVRDSAARLRPLAEKFRRRFGPSKKALLEALYSFVLSIPYRPTPPVEGGRYTAGVSVPLRVLADDRADCDSKAVLFAALWLNLCGHRTVLIRVPEHMLVGVAVPFGNGMSIDIGSTRYLLLELSCPRQLAPGEVSLYSAEALSARNYKYRIVS
jgi:hypothetical protein